ncbi:hypothetical protein OKW38_006016 [Paraburkholderia sp. MM5496-R1]
MLRPSTMPQKMPPIEPMMKPSPVSSSVTHTCVSSGPCEVPFTNQSTIWAKISVGIEKKKGSIHFRRADSSQPPSTTTSRRMRSEITRTWRWRIFFCAIRST